MRGGGGGAAACCCWLLPLHSAVASASAAAPPPGSGGAGAGVGVATTCRSDGRHPSRCRPLISVSRSKALHAMSSIMTAVARWESAAMT